MVYTRFSVMDLKVIFDNILSNEEFTISEIQTVLDAIHDVNLNDVDKVGLNPSQFNQFLSGLCLANETLRKQVVSLLCMTSARQTETGLRFDEDGMIERLMNELARCNFEGRNKEAILTSLKMKLRDNMKGSNLEYEYLEYNVPNYDNDNDNGYEEYGDDFEEISPKKPLTVGYLDDDKDFILKNLNSYENNNNNNNDNRKNNNNEQGHVPPLEPIVIELHQKPDDELVKLPTAIKDMNQYYKNNQSPQSSPKSLKSPKSQGMMRTFLTGIEIETNEYNSKPVTEILDIHSPTKPIERRTSLKTNRRLELKRNSNFIPAIIYDMLDALREKAQIAEEVIITADEHWRQRMILSLEESLINLKDRHNEEQQNVIKEYKNSVDDYTRNIMGFPNDENCKITKERKEFLGGLDPDKQLENLTNIISEKKDILKSRYRAVRSSLVKRQQHEVENTTKALVSSFAQLESIRNDQLQNIHSALRKAEKAIEHCIPLAENAHKASYNKVLQNRADYGIQNARIAIAHGMELVAVECSKIRKNYKSVHNAGPIEHCLKNSIRPSSAYPGLIFTGRLPSMPFTVSRPSSSKRPVTGMKKVESINPMLVHKRRPQSAPNLGSSKPSRGSINEHQRPLSSKANAQRPISTTGLKIKTRISALREAAQRQKIAAANENETDDEIYDEEIDSDEEKVFENSILEMQRSKNESRKKTPKTKKKKKKIKMQQSTITDSYDALAIQSICPQCKKYYYGDGKSIPSIKSLDRHVSTLMRVKEIVGKRENVDLLITKKERDEFDRRERNKKNFNMKVEKIEKFCSWECVKKKSLVAVPKSFRYEVFQLIDLFAGYIVN